MVVLLGIKDDDEAPGPGADIDDDDVDSSIAGSGVICAQGLVA